MNWGELFFYLHKFCNLNKWEIWEYTLPQISELMKNVNRYIRFEVETRMSPFQALFGGGSTESNENSNEEDGYHVATEDDIDLLARALGGM